MTFKLLQLYTISEVTARSRIHSNNFQPINANKR